MGLDLIVEGCARVGHEAEWRRILERVFDGDDVSEPEQVRFAEISIPPYERVGAPRVGFDSNADAWIIEVQQAATPEEIAAVLKEFHGHYALPLVTCDGLPSYSHAGFYEGVNEMSFRGAFLAGCVNVLDKRLINASWEHKFPEAAVDYGTALLAAVKAATDTGLGTRVEPKKGLLARLGIGGVKAPKFSLDEQLLIAEAAGKWFVYWGERGHPIRAWT